MGKRIILTSSQISEDSLGIAHIISDLIHGLELSYVVTFQQPGRLRNKISSWVTVCPDNNQEFYH
jgi:hypothetical protein